MYHTVVKIHNLYLGLGATGKGLTILTLPFNQQVDAQNALASAISKVKPDYAIDGEHENIHSIISQSIKGLTDYFAGKQLLLEQVELDLTPHRLTPFQLAVLQKIKTISYGTTRSYKWIAEEINNPKAVRAVGQAVGRNPIPIIIPCHRVLKASGDIGGFTGGLATKRYLLNLEGVAI